MFDIAVATIYDAKSERLSAPRCLKRSGKQTAVSQCWWALCLVQESNGLQYLIEEGARLVVGHTREFVPQGKAFHLSKHPRG